MAMSCEVCGKELDPDEEEDGICKNCRISQQKEGTKQEDEEFIDPGIT